MELKDWFAFYGATLSSIVFAWNVFIYYRDKGSLKVFPYVTNFVGEVILNEPRLVIIITNTGKKPIYVTSLMAFDKHEKSRAYLIARRGSSENLPKRLESGECFEVITSYLSFISPRLASIYAYDSFGKKHKVVKKYVKALYRQKIDLEQYLSKRQSTKDGNTA